MLHFWQRTEDRLAGIKILAQVDVENTQALLGSIVEETVDRCARDFAALCERAETDCTAVAGQLPERICIGNMVPCDLFADVVARNSVAVDLDLYGTRREVYLRQKIPHFIVFERTDHLVAQRIVP